VVRIPGPSYTENSSIENILPVKNITSQINFIISLLTTQEIYYIIIEKS